MGVRITPQILIDTVLADIRGAHGRLAETQRMLATGRRTAGELTRPRTIPWEPPVP